MIGQNRHPVTKRAHYNGCRYCPIIQFLAQAGTGKTKSDENEQKRKCLVKIFSIFLIILFTTL
jgi:hypothetical protein